jgi:hypothetical protein
MSDRDNVAIVDTSLLTDADWAEINKLRRAYEIDGSVGLSKVLKKLASDPVRYVMVTGALFPDMIRNAIKDRMAEMGVTKDDLKEMARRLQPPPTKQ